MESLIKSIVFICSSLWYFVLLSGILNISESMYHVSGIMVCIIFLLLTYSITIERDNGTTIYELMPRFYRQTLNIVVAIGVSVWMLKEHAHSMETIIAFMSYSAIYTLIILYDFWRSYERKSSQSL